MGQFVPIEGEAAEKLRASEKLDSDAHDVMPDEEEKPCPDIWYWHDGTDQWLYDTGMIKHFGSDKVFLWVEESVVLVFKSDAVGLTKTSNFPDLKL